jgi:hypothetical protein
VSIVPLLLATLLSSGGDEVVARVDQVSITRAMLSRRVEGAGKNGVSLTPSDALDTLITDALLSAEGRRLGLDRSPAVAKYVERALRRAAAAALVDSYATRRDPDEATLRKMFHATADLVAYEFLSYASQQEARAARQRIDKGASFAAEEKGAVASRLYPKAAEAPSLMRAQVPAPLAATLFAAAPGALVGPAEDEKGGWLVARVLRKEIGGDADFAARRPALVASLYRQTLEAARGHLAEQLRAKAAVKVDEQFLRGLRGAEASPQQLQHVIATVGGTPLRYAEIHSDVLALGGQGGHMASAGVKIQLATALVNERLLEAFAVERGFDKAPEVAAQRPELERNGLAGLVTSNIQSAVKRPTSREIESEYQKNAARYARPLAEVRPRVEAELIARKRGEAVQARIGELRAKASVSIDGAALARAGR